LSVILCNKKVIFLF